MLRRIALLSAVFTVFASASYADECLLETRDLDHQQIASADGSSHVTQAMDGGGVCKNLRVKVESGSKAGIAQIVIKLLNGDRPFCKLVLKGQDASKKTVENFTHWIGQVANGVAVDQPSAIVCTKTMVTGAGGRFFNSYSVQSRHGDSGMLTNELGSTI